MNFTVKRIGDDNCRDINIKNEPFSVYGRMIPSYDGEWSYTTLRFDEKDVFDMTFPDENYDYEKLKENSFFAGAYSESGECVALAIYQRSWNRYLYLYDLKVNAEYRHSGVGKALIDEGKKIAYENGYSGIYTQGQDNNLTACLFYVNTGFKIGGLDTMVYKGTKQEGKSDIIFYLDL